MSNNTTEKAKDQTAAEEELELDYEEIYEGIGLSEGAGGATEELGMNHAEVGETRDVVARSKATVEGEGAEGKEGKDNREVRFPRFRPSKRRLTSLCRPQHS